MKYLLLFSFIIFCFHFSYSQELDLNKTDIKLEVEQKIEEVKDTVNHLSMKINYSYFSGLDFLPLHFRFDNLIIERDKINESKSGIISLSLHYSVNKWKFGLGLNYSNYNSTYRNYEPDSMVNFYSSDYSHFNIVHSLNTSHRILTPFVTLDRFFLKNLYIGLHIGCNFIRTEDKYYDLIAPPDYKSSSTDIANLDNIPKQIIYRFLPYTKFCVGYQFKLYNQLNFNLELGVGGSMTNTGVSYLFR